MRDIALIGSGYWGKNIARNLHEIGRLAVVVDSSEDALAAARENYEGVRGVDRISEVLEDDSVKAVFIATPAQTHAELAVVCLQAGKDVFVEKPMCLSLDEGRAIRAAVKESGQLFMVGHLLLFHPCVRRLKQMIEDGELGRIQYIYSNRLNFGKIRTNENSFWSFAPHDISIINYLLGEAPVHVRAEGTDQLTDRVHDTTLSLLEYPSGPKAHIFVSWLHPYKEQRLVVVGDKGMGVFSDTASEKLMLYPHEVDWINRIPVANKAEGKKVEYETWEPLRRECEHFLECVDNRTMPLADVENGFEVLEVLIASDRSLESGGERVKITGADPSDMIHPSSYVHPSAQIGKGTSIWHFSQVMKDAVVGERCNFGQNVQIGPGVQVGNNVKIQNNVSVYSGVEIEDDVFLGPSCVLTNVTNPRSQVNRRAIYEETKIRRGATVGANATIVCGIELGRYCFIAAGAVVCDDVPDYALMAGVPAEQKGWMSRHGHPLTDPDADGVMTCRESGLKYKIESGVMRCLDLDEDAPLPENLAAGTRSYDEFKS